MTKLHPPVATAPGCLPLLGHLLPMMRRPVEFMESLPEHREAVAVHFGPQRVYALTSAELCHRVMVSQARDFERSGLFRRGAQLIGEGLATTDGAVHLRQRRLMQPAFHHRRMPAYSDIMTQTVVTTVDEWRDGEAIELDRELMRITTAVLARTILGADLCPSTIGTVQRAVPALLSGVVRRTVSPFPWLDQLPTAENRRFTAAQAQLRRLVQNVIAERRADSRKRSDLLSALLGSSDERGQQMTDDELHAQVVTLMIAGAETTAVTLAWLFHELGRHSQVEGRLQAEVDEVLGGRPATYSDIPRLPYTRQVISETLRLHYPGWIAMRRAVTGTTLGPLRLRAGDEICYSPYSLYRDPVVFSAPRSFDPDRWSPQRAGQPPRTEFFPFGLGRHQCIGEGFSWNEAIIVAATIVGRCVLRPKPGHTVRPVLSVAMHPNAVPMSVHRRDPVGR